MVVKSVAFRSCAKGWHLGAGAAAAKMPPDRWMLGKETHAGWPEWLRQIPGRGTSESLVLRVCSSDMNIGESVKKESRAAESECFPALAYHAAA